MKWIRNFTVLFAVFVTLTSATEVDISDDDTDINDDSTEISDDGTDITDVHVTPDNEGTDVNTRHRKSEILDEILRERDYDTKIRPMGQNGSGPVHVSVDIFLRNIENVDDVRMEYIAQIIYRQSWLDRRLAFDPLQKNVTFLHLINQSRIWTPDVFFANEKRGMLHTLVRPNVFTLIHPEGGVVETFRFTLLLSCPMDLSAYPLDIQTCPIKMGTYAYSTRDIVLDWNPDSPVQYKAFRMPQFRVVSCRNRVCTVVTTVDRFSCLVMEIELQRAFGFFLIQFYIPCALVVLVSWVGFWLEPTAIEARVSLGVTTILTIVSQTYGINQIVPPASYIKALDIWTAICQILIFGSLIQFALVNYTSQLSSPVLKRLQALKGVVKVLGPGNIEDFEGVDFEKLKFGIEKAKRIDHISRILFPLIFLVFNICYWTSYGAFH